MKRHMTLTKSEKLILESYESVLEGMAAYLGNGFEFILHSLEDLDHSAVVVVNGSLSNRSIGAPITDLALKMIEEIKKETIINKNRIYHNRSSKGSPIRAATLPIFGENRRLIGLICINFYMDLPLCALLENWTRKEEAPNGVNEALANSSDDLIFSGFEEAKSLIINNYDISHQNKNKTIISLLYHKGIFQLKNAVAKVAEMLNISQNTVYLHIRNLKESEILK